MHWYKKTFSRYSVMWAADQDRFANLQLRIANDGTDTYRKMMMVTAHDDPSETEDVYLCIADQAYAQLFPGYERVAMAPVKASTLLVGDQPEFERLFPQGTN